MNVYEKDRVGIEIRIIIRVEYSLKRVYGSEEIKSI
jgi:hypothetical protein